MKRLVVILIMLLVAVSIGDATTHDTLPFISAGLISNMPSALVAKQQTHSIMAVLGSNNASLNAALSLPNNLGIARYAKGGGATSIASDVPFSLSLGNSASASNGHSGNVNSGGASSFSGNASNSGGAASGSAGGYAGPFNTAMGHSAGKPVSHIYPSHDGSGGGIPRWRK